MLGIKKSLLSGYIRFLILAAIFFVPGLIFAGNPGAKEILKKADMAEGYRSCFFQGKQIITTSSGAKRTLVVRTWSVNSGDKQLAEYLSPADIRGQKMLMTDDGDNIWMFNPETRRTRKLGSHMRKKKVMGSDFTYEDQSGGKQSEKYTGSLLREEEQGGAKCFVLDLKPTPKGPSYSKIVAWIGKADYITRRIDFYEEGNRKPFKRLIMEDIRSAGKKLVPYKMTMTNLEDKTETVSIVTKIRFGVKIPGSIFLSRNLGR